jgi:multicomponent Na+:H+ antiporter subunit D
MLVLGPFLLPMITALVSASVRGRLRRVLDLLGGVLLFAWAVALFLEVAVEGRQSLAVGAWPLPYAIELAADGLSAGMVLLVALVSLLVLIFQAGWRESPELPGLSPLQHGLIAATMAALLSADLFNLYVWFELMLMATLGLLALGGGQRNQEAAFKYFSLNMLGALVMLAAVGLIYGATGDLNLAALAQAAREPTVAAALPAYLGLLLAALLLKAGAFPLFAWLPAAYHTLPAPLLALVGGLLTKITVYVLLRLTGQVFDAGQLYEVMGWLAVVTMLSGVLGAAYHWDLRRILSFHIVSQIGYLLLGLAMASQAAAAATGFFLFHNILVKTNLFLIAGLMWLAMGHYDLRRGGGLFPARPLLAGLFLLSAFALVGVPPTTGFWGKFLILREALNQDRLLWAGVALATGLLTLYSMTKIWLEGFWKPNPVSPSRVPLPVSAYAAVITLSLVILLVGLYPEPVIDYLQQHSPDFEGRIE